MSRTRSERRIQVDRGKCWRVWWINSGYWRGWELERGDVLEEKIYGGLYRVYGGGELEGGDCLVTFDIYTFYGGVCVILDVDQWNNCGVEVEGRRKV